MALPIPSITDIYNKIKTGLFGETDGKLEAERDPFVRSISKVQSEILNDSYKVSNDSIAQTFSQTATEESFLKSIAFDRTNNKIKRKEAEFAQGRVLMVFTASENVPIGTQFITSDGQAYESTSSQDAQNQQASVSNLQRVSGFAIATIEDHEYGNNMEIVISGASGTDPFDGTHTIEVVDKDTIRYVNAGVDETATGTITSSFFGARVNVQSVSASLSANKTFTDNIEIVTVFDFSESAFITFNGIVGGNDIESLTDFKSRLVKFLATPQNPGNIKQHEIWVEQNTDANFVNFFQSEDAIDLFLTGVVSKIDSNFDFTNFSVNELDEIKNQFITANQLILGIESLNLSIVNPSFVNINISISSLTPNTLDMKSSIDLVIKEYISLLPVKKLLSLSQLSDAKMATIATLAVDSSGNSPSFDSLSVSGTGGLDSDTKKPILGVVTYA